MSLKRTILETRVKNRNQIQKAKEEGNTNLLFGLMVLGGLLFASHAFIHQVGHVKMSLRKIFESLMQRAGQALAREDIQKVAESTGNAMDLNKEKERD